MASNVNQHNQLLQLFAAYAKRLDKLYDDFVNRLIASLPYSEDEVWERLATDPLFRFDQLPYLSARLQHIFDDYVNKQVLCYKAGITDGVALAFSQDKINLGKYTILQDEAIKAARNAAVASFIANRMSRKEGLSLSDKVWNYSQLGKSEVEMGISNVLKDGLKAGTSAEELGRKVRQYLNNPTMMYRRYWVTVADHAGNKKKVARWYRRHIDEKTGKVTFSDEPLEKVGTGVYRSARMNGYRLMRTEINMSYHKVNASRWANEPFVRGIRIWLSPQHPKPDICDDLVGEYPKTFIFSGFHPSCMCAAAPLTIYGDEKRDFYRRLMKGEDMSNFHSKKEITEVDPKFQRYIDDNHDTIFNAAKRGKLAYFLRDNKQFWINNFSKAEQREMGMLKSIKEIADARHAARTEEQAKDIADRWHAHKRVDALIRQAKPLMAELKEYPNVANYKVLQDAIEDRNASFLSKILSDKVVAKKLAYEKTITPEALKFSNFVTSFKDEGQAQSIYDTMQSFVKAALSNEKNADAAVKYMRNASGTIDSVLNDKMLKAYDMLKDREEQRIRDTFEYRRLTKNLQTIKDYINNSVDVIGGKAQKVTYNVGDYWLQDIKKLQTIVNKDLYHPYFNMKAINDNALFVAQSKSPIVHQLYDGILNALRTQGLNTDVDDMIAKLDTNISRLKSEAAKKAKEKVEEEAANKPVPKVAPSKQATIGDIEKELDKIIANIKDNGTKEDYYSRIVKALEGSLIYSRDYLSDSLEKRAKKLMFSVRAGLSNNKVSLDLERFKHGIAVQEAYDRQVWKDFTNVEIKNCREIEEAIGIRKGRPMTIESADTQSANRHFVDQYINDKNGGYIRTVDGIKISVEKNPAYKKSNEQYHINCATCSPTYALREKGFNITAKGRHATPKNEQIAHSRSFEVWKNADGTDAKPTLLSDWANSKGYIKMSEKRYREFYNENTKEPGTYIVTVAWSKKNGHATILKRLKTGKLVYIEPQQYFGDAIGATHPIDDLCHAYSKIVSGKGIMRVDDKLFDPDWCSIFEK